MSQLDPSISNMLEAAAAERSEVFIGAQGMDLTFTTKILKSDDHEVILKNTLDPRFIKAFTSATKYYMQCQMIRFGADKIGTDGKNFIFPVDSNSVIEETRQAHRYPFTDEEHVVCELLNPLDQETRLIKSVIDMSDTGVSIRSPHDSKLFQKGQHFGKVRILVDGQQYKLTSGTVVYVRKLFDIKGKLLVQVGLKFD